MPKSQRLIRWTWECKKYRDIYQMKHVKLFEQFIAESVDLVHVYDKDGEMYGTGELVKTKGKKSLIRWDGSNEEWIDSNLVKMVESAVSEKREDVGKYNTVKKVISELGRRPSEQELATFINNNYYDVTEVERGEDDPTANDKIADLVGFYKFDIEDWETAWADAQNESVVNEAKPAGLSKKETLKVAQKFAAALTKLDGMKYTVSSDYEEDSFDLDIEDQDDVDPRITGEYAGGSYNINADGSVVNMAIWNKKNSSPVYGNMDDDIKTIIKTIKNIKESVVTESFRVGKVLAIKKYNVKTNRKEVVDVRVTDYIKKPGSKDFVEYDLKGKKRKVSVDVFKSMIAEDAVNVTPESDVKIDDYTSDNGEEILSVEIVGAIVSSESEDEFLQYFYDTYGEGAFTKTDTATLVKYYNEYLEEVTAKETEEEEEAEKAEGGDDELDMDI